MAKNLAGKIYEVFTADGKRWIIDSEHQTRAAALEKAEDLLSAGNHDGVRVLSENERTGEEAIIFEDFHDVKGIADELHLLSELSSWDVIRSPEYTRRSLEFQRVATRLAEVAAEKNLDGLALGYVELTLQCFQCHRYMRETRRVENGPHAPALRGAWVR